jgi:hypothetical protein
MSIDTHTHDDRQLGTRLWEQWTAMWNGDLALAERIVTDDFRIHFGSQESLHTERLRGPNQLAGFIGEHRAGYRTITYRTDVGPIVDLHRGADGTVSGHVACRWLVDAEADTDADAAGGPVTKGGIDVLRVVGDRVAETWSVTGARRLGPTG